MVLRSRHFPCRFAHRLICVAVFGIALGGSFEARSAPPQDAGGPIRKGPYLQALGASSVEVRAEVSPAASASLEVREAGKDAGKPLTFEDASADAFHVIRATGLSPKTNYEYVFRSHGVSQKGRFTTAPKNDAQDPFSFLVYGDNRTDEVGHAAVVRAMLAVSSDFLLHTGDFVQDGSNALDWQLFFDIEAPLLRDRAAFACIGNHELVDTNGENYLRYFGLQSKTPEKPNLYSSFRWGNTRFFLLNAMDTFETGAERAWLDAELSRADAEPGIVWRVAVLHHAPWSAGPHGGNARVLKAHIPELLAKHKIDVIFGGHDHIYERGFADGLRYVISGGGGAPLYRIDKPLPSTRKVESARHFVDVTVSPSTFALVATRDDGTTLDKCSFTKTSREWDCDPDAPMKIVQPASAATAVTTESSGGKSHCACSVVGASDASNADRTLLAMAGACAAAMAIVVRRRAR